MPSPAIVIDTGGLIEGGDKLSVLMASQVKLAVNEADVVVLLVDGRDGLTPGDKSAAELVRRAGKPVLLAVNKAEGRPPDEIAAEFYELGIGEPMAISAERGDRVDLLMEQAIALCPELGAASDSLTEEDGLRIAVVGRPNVGKSTLINRIVGEERLLAFAEAGTTRDSIYVPFESEGERFLLVDTAGIRRRAKVKGTVEKFSVVKALQAIDTSDAVILLLDAREGVSEQDVSLIGLVLDRGRAMTLGINKWDGLAESQRQFIRQELDRRLPFLDFVEQHFISALHGSGIFELLASAKGAADSALRDLPTRQLAQVLADAIAAHPPPVVRGRRIKLSYAHQGGKRPPIIVIHGNQTERVPISYRRYLTKRFRRALSLRGTPVRLQFRTSRNPFAGLRNRLTPRQLRHRRRLKQRRGRKGR
jgi:GTP-binding protein